jgi:hypothetical protein
VVALRYFILLLSVEERIWMRERMSWFLRYYYSGECFGVGYFGTCAIGVRKLGKRGVGVSASERERHLGEDERERGEAVEALMPGAPLAGSKQNIVGRNFFGISNSISPSCWLHPALIIRKMPVPSRNI